MAGVGASLATPSQPDWSAETENFSPSTNATSLGGFFLGPQETNNPFLKGAVYTILQKVTYDEHGLPFKVTAEYMVENIDCRAVKQFYDAKKEEFQRYVLIRSPSKATQENWNHIEVFYNQLLTKGEAEQHSESGLPAQFNNPASGPEKNINFTTSTVFRCAEDTFAPDR